MTNEKLNNPMRFSLGDRNIDIGKYDVIVTKIEIKVSEGNLFVHWEE